VPAHFGLRTPSELAEAIHLGRISSRRVIELAPLVLAEAADDAVAAEIVGRLSAEVVALARVALTRLDLTREPVDVVLGGGLLQSADGHLVAAIDSELRDVAPKVVVRTTGTPAIVGAALLGLDDLGSDAAADARLRSELDAAARRIEQAGGARNAEASETATLGRPNDG
jgi:hypothetical protein